MKPEKVIVIHVDQGRDESGLCLGFDFVDGGDHDGDG